MAHTPTAWPEPVTRLGETVASHESARPVRYDYDLSPRDPYADEPKWAAWKVMVAVIVLCGGFWAGIGYIAMRLLS